MNPISEAAQSGGSEPRTAPGDSPITVVTAEGAGGLSVTEAARALAGARHKSRDQEAGQRRDDWPPPDIESSSLVNTAAKEAPQPDEGGVQAAPGGTDNAL